MVMFMMWVCIALVVMVWDPMSRAERMGLQWRSRRPVLKLLTLKPSSSGLGVVANTLLPLLEAGFTVVTVERPSPHPGNCEVIARWHRIRVHATLTFGYHDDTRPDKVGGNRVCMHFCLVSAGLQ